MSALLNKRNQESCSPDPYHVPGGSNKHRETPAKEKGLLQNEQKLFKMQRLLFICKKTKRQVRKPAQLCRIKLCNITQYVPTIADSETENNWFYRSIQKSLFRRMTQ